MNLLLVEDDELLGKSIQRGLIELGHNCRWLNDGSSAIAAVKTERFEVVVLDLMLPDVSGLKVLEAIRSGKSGVRVLVLTALGSVEERVRGLNAGADDYLVKPFAFAELSARVHALSRRTAAESYSTADLQAGPITLNLVTRIASREGTEIELTTTEYKLLEFLMRHSDQTVTRRMLCEHLWDADWEGVTNVIEVHINRLRSKIDRGFRKPLIHTVRGIGYAIRTR
jgi:two-component system OmpR family response regulator/two-component system copper resistance phosphate regulon response regulator CusR